MVEYDLTVDFEGRGFRIYPSRRPASGKVEKALDYIRRPSSRTAAISSWWISSMIESRAAEGGVRLLSVGDRHHSSRR